MAEHRQMIADLCRETGKLVEIGRLFGARTAIEKANANLSGAVGELHGQVWYLQGVTYLRLGDWHLTISACQRFLKHVDAYPALAAVLVGPVHYHLGVAYRHRHQSERILALSHLNEAIGILRTEGFSDLLLKALHEAAWLTLQDENVDAAHCYLDEADLFITAPGSRATGPTTRASAAWPCAITSWGL